VQNKFKVLEFRKILTEEKSNPIYNSWSRVYEYPLVLDLVLRKDSKRK